MRDEDLIGVWMLRRFHLEGAKTGRTWGPFGPRPAGTIMLHPGGRFFALMTPGERSTPVGDAEQAAAFRDLIAYSGHYRIEPPNRLITRVDISWFESWLGTDQLRFFTRRGDELELVSAPLNMPGSDGETTIVFARVLWRRESPEPRAAG